MAFLQSELDAFRSEVLELMKTHKVPNFILTLILPDLTLSMTEGPETNEHTLFPIGSCSKGFAATLVARLVDQGKLKWDDSIHKYIKVVLPNDTDLTISQLLSHINPFPEHALTQASEFGFSREELWNKLQYIPVESSYKYSYQNVLFSLIAGIVKACTGREYEQVLREEILIPLGMTDTTVAEKEYLANQNKVSPHMKSDDEVKAIPYSPYWHILGPPSSTSISLADLTTWMKFHLQVDEHASTSKAPLISEKSLMTIHTPSKNARPPYAMGWWQADEKGLVLCHTGGVTGFETAIAIMPSCGVGIAVSSNLSGDVFPYLAVNKFFGHYLNSKFSCVNVLKLQMPLLQPKLDLNKFVGTFHHPILEIIKVIQQDDKLTLEVGKNKTKATLSPISVLKSHATITPALAQLADHHCFLIKWHSNMEAAGELYYDEDKIAFTENENGDINRIILLAECVTKEPVTCGRIARKPSLTPGLFNHSPTKTTEETRAEHSVAEMQLT
jgi:beta-lactamase class C